MPYDELQPGQVWVAPGPRVLIVRKPERGHRAAYLYEEAGYQTTARSLPAHTLAALDRTGFALVAGPGSLRAVP